jgi:hypothetical protein
LHPGRGREQGKQRPIALAIYFDVHVSNGLSTQFKSIYGPVKAFVRDPDQERLGPLVQHHPPAVLPGSFSRLKLVAPRSWPTSASSQQQRLSGDAISNTTRPAIPEALVYLLVETSS